MCRRFQDVEANPGVFFKARIKIQKRFQDLEANPDTFFKILKQTLVRFEAAGKNAEEISRR